MTNESRRQQIIARLKTMRNAELDRFIDLMLRLREMSETESKQLAETLAQKNDKVVQNRAGSL